VIGLVGGRGRGRSRRLRWLLFTAAAVLAIMAPAAVSALRGPRSEPKLAVAKAVDSYAEREVPTECHDERRSGLLAFKYMIMAQVGGGDSGVHSCRPIQGKTTLSYHADSRAWDWRMNAKRPADRERVDQVLSWLLRTERGVPHANARRLGIGEIIWDREIVTLWSNNPAPPCHHEPTGVSCFRPYDGVNPHTDHVHFSFSVPGANDTMVWSSTRTTTPSWYLTNATSSTAASSSAATPTGATPTGATPTGATPAGATPTDGSTTAAGSIAPFGLGFGFAVPLTGDWDGDGSDSLGLYDPRDRRFYLRNTLTAGPPDMTTVPIGPFGGIPFVGDWNGDGIDEFGVYTPTTRRFIFADRYGQQMRPSVVFGDYDDLPLIGNWDGRDPDDEIGVYRPSQRMFERQLDPAERPLDLALGELASPQHRLPDVAEVNRTHATVVGQAGDVPLAGYFDGDGSEDIGVFRASDRTFYLQTSAGTVPMAYGNHSATPVVGDWDGDGRSSPGVGLTLTGPISR